MTHGRKSDEVGMTKRTGGRSRRSCHRAVDCNKSSRVETAVQCNSRFGNHLRGGLARGKRRRYGRNEGNGQRIDDPARPERFSPFAVGATVHRSTENIPPINANRGRGSSVVPRGPGEYNGFPARAINRCATVASAGGATVCPPFRRFVVLACQLEFAGEERRRCRDRTWRRIAAIQDASM